MASSVHQFGKAIVASGLMTADELKQVWEQTPASDRPTDDRAFATRLIAAEKLTPFQARELLALRGDRLVLGDYVLLAELGEGGMGRVFQARHRGMKRVVAVKLLSHAATKDAEAQKRFQREVEAAARLEHPNIVTAYDSGTAGDVKYLVMQFVDGEDLSALVRRTGPLPFATAIDYIAQAARGLAFAHDSGVVHRDVKPANLLVDKRGVVRVLDLGLAAFTGVENGLTGRDQVMGTIDYMSPEQSSGSKGMDGRTDIYSLGCTLWFLLTARSVYGGKTAMARIIAHHDSPIPSLTEARRDVPRDFEPIMRRMLAKTPQERYGSMHDLLAALATSAVATADARLHGVAGSSGVQVQSPISIAVRRDIDVEPTAPHVTSPALAATAAHSPSGAREVDTDPLSRTISAASLRAGAAQAKSQTATDFTVAPSSRGTPNSVALNRRSTIFKLVAAGFVAAAILAAGIILKVKDREGRVVAEMNVPHGVSVEVAQTPDKRTASAPTPTVTIARNAGPEPLPSSGLSAHEILTSHDYVWSTPEPVSGLFESEPHIMLPTLTADELCLVFNVSGPKGELYMVESRRKSVDAPFGRPIRISGAFAPRGPCLSADGLELFYGAAAVTTELWSRRRESREAAWGVPKTLEIGPTDASSKISPNISPDGLSLMFAANRSSGGGKMDLCVARRRTSASPFEPAVRLAMASSDFKVQPKQLADAGAFCYQQPPGGFSIAVRDPAGSTSEKVLTGLPLNNLWLTADGRRVYFSMKEFDNSVPAELWMMRRLTKAEAAEAAKRTPPLPMVARSGLRFRGADYVDLASDWTYDGGDMTFEAWLLPDATSDTQTLFSIDAKRDDRRHGIGILRDATASSWHVLHTSPSRHQSFADDSRPGELMHLAVVCVNSQRMLYINGKRYYERNGMPSPIAESPFAAHAWLGAMPDGIDLRTPRRGWKGTILQTRISSRVRYSYPFTPPKQFTADTDTVSLFRFEEGAGTILNDASGKNRHGKIVSGEWTLVTLPAATASNGPPPKPPVIAPPKPVLTAYLDDLSERSSSATGQLGKHGIGPGNAPFEIAGHPIAHALYIPPRAGEKSAFVEYDLDGRYEHLMSRVAILHRVKDPITFRVLIDGRSAVESPPMTEPRMEFNHGFRLNGAKKLRLEVSGPIDVAQPVWIEPEVKSVIPPILEKKPRPVDPPPGPWIDVLAMIDPQLDKLDVPGVTKKNDWRLENGELHYRGDDAEGDLIWPIQLDGPGMEFEVEFTRLAGDRGVTLCLPSYAAANTVSYDVIQPGRIIFTPGALGGQTECPIITGRRTRIGLRANRYGSDEVSTAMFEGRSAGTVHHGRWIQPPPEGSVYGAASFRQILRLEPKQDYVFHSIRARPLQGGTIVLLRPAAKPNSSAPATNPLNAAPTGTK